MSDSPLFIHPWGSVSRAAILKSARCHEALTAPIFQFWDGELFHFNQSDRSIWIGAELPKKHFLDRRAMRCVIARAIISADLTFQKAYTLFQL